MKKRWAALALALLLLWGCGLAEGAYPGAMYDAFWIIPDSDSRLLTEAELWQYTRETLAYIRNEILARVGYAFETVKFYDYFNAKPWYMAGGFRDGQGLSAVAWTNVDTIKAVERAMKNRGDDNPGGISIAQIIAYQNSQGGYGDQLDYGNSRGVGAGSTLADSDPSYRGQDARRGQAVLRGTPRPRYCYTSQYIIPDSDVRPLTEGELWAYTRETLRYIRNEILARHGYAFRTEKFLSYFSGKSWYSAGGYSDSLLSNLEWTNVDLIKRVEREMDAQGVTNAGYLDISTIIYMQETGQCAE